MAQKIVGYQTLELFWNKLNKWLQFNFESLFNNDKELETEIQALKQQLANITERLQKLEATDFTTEEIEDNSDYENI